MEEASDPDSAIAPHPGTSGISQEELVFLRQELGPDLEFLGELGRGRMATVYLARERRLGRLVAVKVLSWNLSDDPVAMTRFEREAMAAASLDHQHAVTVYRSGILSNRVPFQIMQYVKGGTLENHLAAEGPRSEAEACRILSEIADALAAAHKRGFVHRDLRPDNVLCDEEGCRVLVSDFGLAGILPHARGDEPRITRIGEVLSDPLYSSPELLRGEDLTEGADIYALGIMGYEILTGEGPFPKGPGRVMAAAHLRAQPRPLASLRPDVSPTLADLLERCLAKDPNKRPRAAFLARSFREASGLESDRIRDEQESPGLVRSLLKRRLPQVVVLTAVVGWGLQDFIQGQVDVGLLDMKWYGFTWATVVCAVGVAGIIAWFHGKKGKQEVTPLEIGLVSLLALIWAVAGVMILRV